MVDSLQHLVSALVDARLCFFLGEGTTIVGRPPNASWEPGRFLPTHLELSAYLTAKFDCPAEVSTSLGSVTQYIAEMHGRHLLNEQLREVYDRDYPPNSLHEFFAALPARLRKPNAGRSGLVFLTLNYDDLLERAFRARDEPFDVITYATDGGEPTLIHIEHDGKSQKIKWPNEYVLFGLQGQERPIILKLLGQVSAQADASASVVITEDDYLNYPNVGEALPTQLRLKLVRSRVIYLGCSSRSQGLRVVFNRLWGNRERAFSWWAIQLNPGAIESAFWEKRDVKLLDMHPEDFILQLDQRLESATPQPESQSKEEPPKPKTLKPGSSGAEVAALQTQLKELGFGPSIVDGLFGPGTKSAVEAFQRSKKLPADGIASPEVIQALQSDTSLGASEMKTTADATAPTATADSTITENATTDIEEIEKMVDEFARSGNLDPSLMERVSSLQDHEAIARITKKLQEMMDAKGVSKPPLKIGDFYRPGTKSYELRWPLSPTLSLPVPFEQLPHETQFHVLFQEWTRRELEGSQACYIGDLPGAEAIYHECLQRAEQLDVAELKARSFEGLMRVAQKTGNSEGEHKWRAAANAAREQQPNIEAPTAASTPVGSAPIVLVHGIVAYNQLSVGGLKIGDYFRLIPDALKKDGHVVPEPPRLDPSASANERAQQLKDYLLNPSNSELFGKKVHLIAHGSGGLDARYMISRLDMADRVLSLTTIGTPHQGTPIADALIGGGNPELSQLTSNLFDLNTMFDLTTTACRTFNEGVIDSPEVRYFAIAGRYNPQRRLVGRSGPLRLTHEIIQKSEGANDGFVSVASASFVERSNTWTLLDTWEVNHFRLINWGADLVPTNFELIDTSIIENFRHLAKQIASGFIPRPSAERETVRSNPAQYIGATDETGLHRLVSEVVDSSIKEVAAGYCDSIEVTIHGGNSITVVDNGRGIPVEEIVEDGKTAAELAMTRLSVIVNFPSRRGDPDEPLEASVAVVNFLSQSLHLEIWRDGITRAQDYARGLPITPLSQTGKTRKRGKRITFTPDPEIFDRIYFSFETLTDSLSEQAMLNKGLRITLKDERTKPEQVRELYYRDPVGHLLKMLSGRKHKELLKAITLLGKLPDERPTAPLLQTLARARKPQKRTAWQKAESVEIQVAIARTFGEMRDPKTLTALVSLMNNKSAEVREAAAKAVRQFNEPSTINGVFKLLRDPVQGNRQLGAQIIGELTGTVEATLLLELLHSEEEEVVEAAIKALDETGDARNPAMWNALIVSVNAKVRQAAFQALERIEEPEASDLLIELLQKDKRLEVLKSAVIILGKIGGELAISALKKARASSDTGLADAAKSALAELGVADIADEIVEFVDSPVCDWALRKVDKWLARTEPRVCLLTGVPRVSTLLLKCIKAISEGNAGAQTYSYLIRGSLSALHMQSGPFVEDLSRQLANHYPAFSESLVRIANSDERVRMTTHAEIILSDTVTLIDSLDLSRLSLNEAFELTVRQPFKELYSRDDFNEQTLIAVDALDHEAWQVISLLSESDDLPAHIRFLFTCRRNAPGVSELFPGALHIDFEKWTALERQFAQLSPEAKHVFRRAEVLRQAKGTSEIYSEYVLAVLAKSNENLRRLLTLFETEQVLTPALTKLLNETGGGRFAEISELEPASEEELPNLPLSDALEEAMDMVAQLVLNSGLSLDREIIETDQLVAALLVEPTNLAGEFVAVWLQVPREKLASLVEKNHRRWRSAGVDLLPLDDIWRASTRRPLTVPLRGHENSVTSVAFSADGKILVSGDATGAIHLWDVNTLEDLHVSHVGSPELDGIQGIAVVENDKVLTGTQKGIISVFNLKSLGIVTLVAIPGLTAFASNPRGQWVSGHQDGSLSVGTVDEVLRSLTGHTAIVSDVAVSSDGRLAVSVSLDQTLRFWDLPAGRLLRTFESTGMGLSRVVMLPDGNRAVWGGEDGSLIGYDLASGQQLFDFEGHQHPISAMAVIDGGRQLVTTSNGGKIRAWNLETREQVISDRGPKSGYTSLAVAPDGRTLATGSDDNLVRLWDRASLIPPPVVARQSDYYRLVIKPSSEAVAVGERLLLNVSLVATQHEQDAFDLPPNVASLSCFVTTDDRAFRIQGSEAADMRLDSETNQYVPINFELQAYLPGSRCYSIQLFAEDSATGKVRIYETVGQIKVTRLHPGIARPPMLTSLEIRVAAQPDFVLQVESYLPEGEDGPNELNYRLSSRLPGLLLRNEKVGSAVLPPGETARLRVLLFSALQAASGMRPDDARQRLISFGTYLFNRLFPSGEADKFREVYRQAANHLTTWLVVEDGVTWLPWELLVPYQHGDDEPPQFLGERFQMSRWIEFGPSLYGEVPFGEIALAHYKNSQTMDHNEDLAAWGKLLNAASAHGVAEVVKQERPCHRLHLLRYAEDLEADRRGLVARKGAGEVASPNADAKLARLDLRLKRPIVTLSILDGHGSQSELKEGWPLPDRVLPFLRAGASAVVGPWWPTSETADRIFWRTFYELLDPQQRFSLGEAVWRARQTVKRALPHKPDWLAYTLFGDPRARAYDPEPSEGYTTLERLNADQPLRPGQACYFRASISSRPSFIHQERLVETQASNLPKDPMALFLARGLQDEIPLPIEMKRVGRNTVEAIYKVIPKDVGEFMLIARLYDGEERLQTLQLPLLVEHA